MNTIDSSDNLLLEIDHDSPVPLHAQVEQILRKLIQQEEYQNGKLLPGEQEMSKKLGVSRNTFRAAMNKLVYDGLVVRKKGIGTKVSDDVVQTQLTAWTSFTKEMNAKGRPFEDISKKVSRVESPQEVSEYLGIDPGTKVQKLERVRGEHGQPVVLFISYFHPRIGIPQEETFDGRLYELLEEKYHVIPVIAKEEITAQTPDEHLRNQLQMDETTPVLIRKHLACDAAERPIEFCYACYHSEKFVYQITIKRRNNE